MTTARGSRRKLLGESLAATPRHQPTASMGDDKPTPRPIRKRVDVQQRPVMTIEETAAYLNLSPQTVYAEVRKGTLPIVQFGRRKLIVRALLDEMLIARAKKNWDTEDKE